MAIYAEKYIERRLTTRVREVGGYIRKVQWVGRRGAPDRLVAINLKVCWVELKATGQKVSRHQAKEHRWLRAHGMRIEVLDSPEKVDALVAELASA